jgi:salicylate hydroxylase
LRIGIVGLGLGGAAAAAALTHRGCDVTIFEQASEVREVGAGVAIWPSTSRLFGRIGLAETLDHIGVRAKQFPSHDAKGSQFARAPTVGDDGAPTRFLHRADLLQVLSNMLPTSRLRLGRRCAQAADEGQCARLTFEDGSSETFDVVLGADGIRSVVQHAVVPQAPPIFSQLAAYRGLIPNGADLALDDGMLWTDRRRYIVTYPVAGGRLINFVGVVPASGSPEASWSLRGSPEALAAEFEGWDPRICRIIGAVTETFLWGLYYRDPLPRIVSGRVALLGDAAHPMTPHAGMGFGQAIEDGFALAVLLAGATAPEAPDRLRLYEALRLPRTSAVQAITRRNVQFFHEAFPLALGESRPDRPVPLRDLVEYDVEAEARRVLESGQG